MIKLVSFSSASKHPVMAVTFRCNKWGEDSASLYYMTHKLFSGVNDSEKVSCENYTFSGLESKELCARWQEDIHSHNSLQELSHQRGTRGRPRTAAQPLTSKISTYFYTLKCALNKLISLKSLPNVLVIRADIRAKCAHFKPPPLKLFFYSCL